jgi:hypothetical protein
VLSIETAPKFITGKLKSAFVKVLPLHEVSQLLIVKLAVANGLPMRDASAVGGSAPTGAELSYRAATKDVEPDGAWQVIAIEKSDKTPDAAGLKA